MLQLRAIAAFGWLFFVFNMEMTRWDFMWLPGLGYLLAVLPRRFFPPLFAGQVAILVACVVLVPQLLSTKHWLGYLMVGLSCFLNFALFLQWRRENTGERVSLSPEE